ncbi:hypothetical protein TgHK011_003759 [Trichoderma gracile]|nr:hypothetical protein TgHK011_003759 [Trichoderma gracile]
MQEEEEEKEERIVVMGTKEGQSIRNSLLASAPKLQAPLLLLLPPLSAVDVLEAGANGLNLNNPARFALYLYDKGVDTDTTASAWVACGRDPPRLRLSALNRGTDLEAD